MSTATHITLLIPGLAGPASDHPIGDYLERRPAALDRLLSRSSMREGAVSAEAALFGYFGVRADTGLPVAPVTFYADTGRRSDGYLVRADPVHLRADQSCLRLFESHAVAVEPAEASELAAAFNEFFAGRGLHLQVGDAARWYLSSRFDPAIQADSPELAAGEDINRHLPGAGQAREWLTLFNEVQMLFHDHPVNRAREQRGQAPLNSLWFWGGGRLPASLQPGVDAVIADDALATGLACLCGLPRGSVPGDAGTLLDSIPAGHTLVLLDSLQWNARYADIEAWLAALDALERDWFAPLLGALRRGRVATLGIDAACGRQLHTSRLRQLRFWQPEQAFENRICA